MKRLLTAFAAMALAATSLAADKGIAALADGPEGPRASFAKKSLVWSPTHERFASVMGDTGAMGKLKIDRGLLKGVKKIVIAGFDVARGIDSAADEFPDYDGLANALYDEFAKAFAAAGLEVVGIKEAMATQAYAALDYPQEHAIAGWKGESHADTAYGSKWADPIAINPLSSQINFETESVKRPKLLAKMAPLAEVAKELGADAAMIVSVRVLMGQGGISIGFGQNINSYIVDMVSPADGRIVWSASLKDFLNLKTKPAVSSKAGLFERKYSYDWEKIIPGVSAEFAGLAAATATKLKLDAEGK
jgi:hypothetical protein